MASAVKEHKADAGICLDGDADRLILADEKGSIITGDQTLGRLAMSLDKKGELCGAGVVGTLMSNRGLEVFLKEAGINLSVLMSGTVTF